MSAPAPVAVRGSLSLDQCLREGWKAVMSNPAPAFCGVLVYFAFEMAFSLVSYIPYAGIVGTVARIFVEPALGGGLMILYLNLLYRRQPSVANVFAGFRKLWRFLGATVLFGLLFLGLMIPAVVIGILAALLWSSSQEAGIVLVVVCGVAALGGIVAYIIYWLRWMFALWIIADDWEDGSIITAFNRSAQITQGYRPMLFLLSFVIGLIASAGMVACCVGVIFTAPIAGCATASLYLALKGFHCGTAPLQGQVLIVTPTPPQGPQGTP